SPRSFTPRLSAGEILFLFPPGLDTLRFASPGGGECPPWAGAGSTRMRKTHARPSRADGRVHPAAETAGRRRARPGCLGAATAFPARLRRRGRGGVPPWARRTLEHAAHVGLCRSEKQSAAPGHPFPAA